MAAQHSYQPLISIVVPVYNSESHLTDCLESIRFQTYTEWECIVVDDGSDDQSGKICEGFMSSDSRFRVVHQPNKGVGAARNKGIQLSRGEYITFIDSDDIVHSGYLSDFIRRKPCKDTIIVSGMISRTLTRQFTSFQYEDKDSAEIPAAELIIRYDLFRDGGPTNKLFDLKLIHNANLLFRADISYHEDHIFVYSYYLLAKRIILSGFCGYYYMHYKESGLSLSSVGKKKIFSLMSASDEFLQLLPQLFSKFGIDNDLYMRKTLTRTGISQRVLALYNLYFLSRESDATKKQVLCKEQNFIRTFLGLYYPLTMKRKVFISILKLPLKISHPLLLLFGRLYRFVN